MVFDDDIRHAEEDFENGMEIGISERKGLQYKPEASIISEV